MIAVNHIVLVLFKFINFGVLAGLAWYLFKRYGLPIIRQNLIDYRGYFQELGSTHYHLKQEQRLIEQQIINDRKEQDLLKERLMRWRAHIDDQNKQLLIAREERKKKLKELVAVQQKQIMQHRIFATIMSQALQDARKTLQTAAQDESVQYKIFDTAVSIMRRDGEQ